MSLRCHPAEHLLAVNICALTLPSFMPAGKLSSLMLYIHTLLTHIAALAIVPSTAAAAGHCSNQFANVPWGHVQ